MTTSRKWQKSTVFSSMDFAEVTSSWKTAPHRAVTTNKWHSEHGVKLFLGWPGNSPDINPIESLWSEMKHLQSCERATSMVGMKWITLIVWNKITPAYLQSLYESMPRQMQAVVDAQGGHTKY